MDESTERMVLFEKSGVFIHTSDEESKDALLSGKIQFYVENDEPFVEWNPSREEPEQPEQTQDPDWAVVDTVSYKKNTKENVTVTQPTKHKSRYAMTIPLTFVRTIRKSKPTLGWSYLVFTLADNVDLPPLHFHEGGSNGLVKEMKKHVTLTKSPTDPSILNVTPNNPDALSASFTELQIMGETSANYAHKFFNDPITVTMGGFSKVTNFLRDNLLASSSAMQRPVDDYADLFPDITTFSSNLRAEQGYDLITPTPTKLPKRPEVIRSSPVNESEWSLHMDNEGRLLSVPELLEKIFRGGIEANMRSEIWPFLLQYYPWNSTRKERIKLRKKKEDDYFRMKVQWKTITEEQEKRFSLFRERKSLIDKDVIRTDRVHPFFEGENNPHLDQLFSVLMTYCQLNFDLGYVQGMSDILAPILVVMEDEVDAFWCFVGFMDHFRLCQNFDVEQAGMKNQLIQLYKLLQFIDPGYYGFLQSKDSSNLYFCFRWLLIRFKREFEMDDIMRLWEVMWTGLPCQNFHLLLCLALLEGEKGTMQDNNLDFNEILKHVNEMAFNIDVNKMLCEGEGIYLQLKDFEDLPSVLSEIITAAAYESRPQEDVSSQTSETSSIEILDNVE